MIVRLATIDRVPTGYVHRVRFVSEVEALAVALKRRSRFCRIARVDVAGQETAKTFSRLADALAHEGKR